MKTLHAKTSLKIVAPQSTHSITSNLCSTFFLVFCLGLALTASAQGVTISSNIPGYGFAPLSGEILCLNVKVTGGATSLVNWTVPTGGAVFLPSSGGTTSSVTAGLPMQCIQVTANPGTLTVTGQSGSNALTSTSIVRLHAQSVDDPSQSLDTPLYIAANTTQVRIIGSFYQQVFRNQDATVTADVQGNVDQSGKWTLTSAPAGALPTLSDADKRTVILHAGTPGRYILTFTSNADHRQTGSAIVYMANATSSFMLSSSTYTASPDKTKIVPCEVDPAFSTVYDIGPGQTFADFVSTPSADTVPPGTIYRFHNTDTTGGSPTTLHNYFQITNSGTPTQPIYLCGVPDTYGNLPILDGTNAIGQAGVHQYGACYQYALLCFDGGGFSRGHQIGPYQAAPVGPNYVAAAGIHIRNTRGTLYPPGATTGPMVPWGYSAACVAIQSGTQIDLNGLDIENCANGLYTTENENNGFAATTLGISLRSSHVHLFGNAGSGTEHAIYFQSFFGLVEGTLVDEPLVAGNVGSCIKWRGIDGIFRYNSCPAGVGRDFDGVEVQDDSAYVDLTRWIDNGNYDAGDGSADIIAGLQGTLYNGDWFYGNIIHQAAGEAIHYRADHDGLMAERLGQFYVYNNTVDQALTIFGVGDAQNGGSHYLDPIIHAFNNIFDNAGVILSNYAFGVTNHLTNLYRSGSIFSPGAPIAVSSWYITAGGQLVVNGNNSLVNDYASGVTFSGLSGSSGACLNGTVFPVQYAGTGNFQGPTTCAPIGSDSAPVVERSAVATPRILGGVPNSGSAHGWSNQCYYACPWQLTAPLDSHQFGLTAANFQFTPVSPFDANTFNGSSTTYNAGSALPPAAAQLPVRYQYNPVTYVVEPRTQPLTIGARDASSINALLVPVTTVTSVSVSPSAINLAISATKQLAANCTYSNGSSGDCTASASWSSGSSSIFTVTATGLLTARATGTSNVVAAVGPVIGSASVTVATPTLTVISLVPNPIKLVPGASQQMMATCTYSDSSTSLCPSQLRWVNSSSASFTVSPTGLITANSPGTGIVTAALNTAIANVPVTVTAPPAALTGVSISPSALRLPLNASQQMTATCVYSDRSIADCTATVAWSNSGARFFTISPTGFVTGSAGGTGTITAVATAASTTNNAAAQTFTATTAITYLRATAPTVTKVVLTPAAIGITRSSSIQLSASCVYSDGSTSNCTSSVAWSSDSSAFSITPGGTLTGTTAGSGTATATIAGVSAKAPVVISLPALSSIAITPNYLSILRGATQQLTATCTYADSTSGNCTTSVLWSTGGSTSFTVAPNGLLVAAATGSGTITATLHGVSGIAHILIMRSR